MSAPIMSTPAERDNSPKNTTTGRRRRRQQCGHPRCGKFGHTSETCWTAHPELRPRNQRTGRNALRGAGSRNSTTNTSQPVAASPFIPFRLLDLPSEIRNRIYEYSFCDGYTLTVKEEQGDLDHIIPEEELNKIYFSASPATDLYLANKQIYAESKFATAWDPEKFGGHLVCLIGPPRGLRRGYNTHSLNSADRYTELRSKVTKITYADFTVSKLWGDNLDGNWWGMASAYPNIKEIHVELSDTEQKYKDETTMRFSWRSWNLFRPGGIRAFLQGETDIDNDFRGGANRMRLWHLSAILHKADIKCKIFCTLTLQWCLNDDTPVFEQSIKSMILPGRKSREVGRWVREL